MDRGGQWYSLVSGKETDMTEQPCQQKCVRDDIGI